MNDNEHTPGKPLLSEADIDAIMAQLTPSDPMQKTPAEEFLDAHLSTLYPLLLQGKLINLNNDVDELLVQHHIDSDKIEQMMGAIDAVLEAEDEPTSYACAAAVEPYFSGDALAAQKYFANYMLCRITAERMGLIADPQIEGFGGYHFEGPSGDFARMRDLHDNAGRLEKMLVGYGLGSHQAKHIIQTFDRATIDAIEQSAGVSPGHA